MGSNGYRHIAGAVCQPIGQDGVAWEPNMSPGRFHAMVDAAREHILAGDAFQVVVSQRFRKPLAARPFDMYRCLRRSSSRFLRGQNLHPRRFFRQIGVVVSHWIVFIRAFKALVIRNRFLQNRNIFGIPPRLLHQKRARSRSNQNCHSAQDPACTPPRYEAAM